MLEFVEKLTLFPWLVVESDIHALRRAGFSDTLILHIVLGSAHFNYLNRMADGLGIEFEYTTDIPAVKIQGPTRGAERATIPRGGIFRREGSSAWIRSSGSVGSPAGEPRHLFEVMSENVPVCLLARSWRQYQLTETNELSAMLRVQLALLMSGMNRCDYSVYWYDRLAAQRGVAKGAREELANGLVPASVETPAKSYFLHAQRLTQEPWTADRESIEVLRKTGMDDHGILQLTMLCSYMSFENRVALGLGVALEPETLNE
jgi:alkylhydroperoxidase family enzyme